MVLKIKTSSIIENLKNQMNDVTFSESDFWRTVEEVGSPIFEETGDVHYHNVTLFYRASELKSLHFIPEIEEGQTLEYSFERLNVSSIWYICLRIRNDIRFEYSLLPNDTYEDWDKRCEALVFDSLNKSFLRIEEEGEEADFLSNIIMPNAPLHIWSEIKEPAFEGRLVIHNIESKNLKEFRRVQVYLPFAYDESKSYPFVLFNDGDEYLSILNTRKVLDNLICDQQMDPTIAIFVDSTDNRMKELSGDQSFIDALIMEILPEIKLTYTLNESENTIAGLSLGGSFACHLQLLYPGIFSKVISQSGAFWVEKENSETGTWLTDVINHKKKMTDKVYLDVGILEEKKQMIDLSVKVAKHYRDKGVDVLYAEFNSGHDYLSWGETLAHGLIHVSQ